MFSNFSGKIILGSTSPRRSEILKKLQMPFEVRPSKFDESVLMQRKVKIHVYRAVYNHLEYTQYNSIQYSSKKTAKIKYINFRDLCRLLSQSISKRP